MSVPRVQRTLEERKFGTHDELQHQGTHSRSVRCIYGLLGSAHVSDLVVRWHIRHALFVAMRSVRLGGVVLQKAARPIAALVADYRTANGVFLW